MRSCYLLPTVFLILLLLLAGCSMYTGPVVGNVTSSRIDSEQDNSCQYVVLVPITNQGKDGWIVVNMFLIDISDGHTQFTATKKIYLKNGETTTVQGSLVGFADHQYKIQVDAK